MLKLWLDFLTIDQIESHKLYEVPHLPCFLKKVNDPHQPIIKTYFCHTLVQQQTSAHLTSHYNKCWKMSRLKFLLSSGNAFNLSNEWGFHSLVVKRLFPLNSIRHALFTSDSVLSYCFWLKRYKNMLLKVGNGLEKKILNCRHIVSDGLVPGK